MSEPKESAALGIQPGHKTAWAWTVATFFGAGLGKPGPGTWGSVATVILWSAVAFGLHPSTAALYWFTGALILVATVLGVPAATIAARESGRKDPSIVVIDKGKAFSSDTTTMTQDVYAFPYGAAGLMAGLGIQGSKITPIHPK